MPLALVRALWRLVVGLQLAAMLYFPFFYSWFNTTPDGEGMGLLIFGGLFLSYLAMRFATFWLALHRRRSAEFVLFIDAVVSYSFPYSPGHLILVLIGLARHQTFFQAADASSPYHSGVWPIALNGLIAFSYVGARRALLRSRQTQAQQPAVTGGQRAA